MVGEYVIKLTKFVEHLGFIKLAKKVLENEYNSTNLSESTLLHEIDLFRRVCNYVNDWKKEDPSGDKHYNYSEKPKLSLLEWKIRKYKQKIVCFVKPGGNFMLLQKEFPEMFDYLF